jgi:hypothetical protein
MTWEDLALEVELTYRDPANPERVFRDVWYERGYLGQAFTGWVFSYMDRTFMVRYRWIDSNGLHSPRSYWSRSRARKALQKWSIHQELPAL